MRTPSHRLAIMTAAAAILAPISYAVGRFSTPTLAGTSWQALTPVLIYGGIGLATGLSLGLAYAAVRHTSHNLTDGVQPATPAEVRAALIRELEENLALLSARKGSTGVVARLSYVTAYWEAAKASGQVQAVASAQTLNQVALAYYWLAQANHLETLAYDAKNSGQARDPEFTTAQLISEIRLLDEPLEKALNTALASLKAK